ncbi:unnamed protein product [Scytosiphon promiscuus]
MASGPSWMQRDQGGNMAGMEEGIGVDGANGANPNYGAAGVKAEMKDTNMVRFGFRLSSLVLGVMMIIAAFVELLNLSSFTRFFIALYNILFGGVLILHESQGLVTCEGVDYIMRRYFGLVYGHMGRALFIIFIAFLNFALTDAGSLGTITGMLLLLQGGLMIVVFLKYPHLLDEAPGLGDIKTAAPPRRDDYAPPPTMPSTNL